MLRNAIVLLAAIAFASQASAGGGKDKADDFPLPSEAVRRYGSVSFRHPHPVQSFRIRPDGKVVYTTDGRSVYGWDLATGRRLFVTPPNENPQCWSGIGCTATHLRAVAAEQGGFVVMDLDGETGRVLGKGNLVRVGQYGSVALSPDGEWLLQFVQPSPEDLIQRKDESFVKVRVTDALVAKAPVDLGELNSPYFARFARDGTLFVVTGKHADGPIRAIDPRTGKVFREWPRGLLMQYHGTTDHGFTSWDQNPGGKLGLKAWDAKTGKMRILTESSPHPTGYAVSPRDAMLAVQTTPLSHDWIFTDLALGKETGRLRLAAYPIQTTGEFTPDGKTFVTHGYGNNRIDHVVAPWSVPTGAPMADGHYPRGAVSRLHATPEGRLLAAADGRISAWDVNGPVRMQGEVLDRQGWASSDAWDVRGESIRVARTRRVHYPNTHTEISIVDAITGKIQTTIGARLPGGVTELAFSADGARLYWVDPAERAVVEWDLAVAGTVQKRKFTSFARQLHASANGRWLAAVTSAGGQEDEPSQATVWDLRAADQPPVVIDCSGEPRLQLKFAGNTLVILGCGPKGFLVRGWDIAGNREVWRGAASLPQGFRPGDPVALSPDGAALAVAPAHPAPGPDSKGHSIHLIELITGQVRHSFVGHASPLTALAFTADQQLAAASQDAPIYLWDVRGELTRPAGGLAQSAFDSAWTDLRSADSTIAFKAIRLFAAHPDRSVPFLAAKLPPVVRPDATRFAALLADLNARGFADRERASKELAGLGRAVEKPLREALESTKSAEVRRRLEELLSRLPQGTRSPNDLQAARAVEAMAWAGTPQAKQLLTRWASGEPTATLTAEATRTLR